MPGVSSKPFTGLGLSPHRLLTKRNGRGCFFFSFTPDYQGQQESARGPVLPPRAWGFTGPTGGRPTAPVGGPPPLVAGAPAAGGSRCPPGAEASGLRGDSPERVRRLYSAVNSSHVVLPFSRQVAVITSFELSRSFSAVRLPSWPGP